MSYNEAYVQTKRREMLYIAAQKREIRSMRAEMIEAASRYLSENEAECLVNQLMDIQATYGVRKVYLKGERG